ncbi:MAG: low-specificity L-threonine aldolase [Pirellulales bacterium]|nr:low-specificity L-threonine aldolase [Pirellulales bacterium]
MPDHHLDFRSDTAAWPSVEMRATMLEAPVGDDVFDEDPTVHKLQDRLAGMLGKEAALFVPSGTMANVIAVLLHCRPGEEMIVEAQSHVCHYEQAGHARLAGVAARSVQGERGVMRLEQIKGMIRADDVHFARTRLLWLENTHNRGGGRVLPYDTVQEMCDWAAENSLARHLDGARIFNAAVASGIEASQWASHFDTINVCFSKGLGAPVGSALVGSRKMIREGMRHRKLLGGGMRQAGVLAAAALYALENNIDRLADDHANAQLLARGIAAIDGLDARPEEADTNLVFFNVEESLCTAEGFVEELARHDLQMLATGPQTIRASLHLDISEQDVERALEIIEGCARDEKRHKT